MKRVFLLICLSLVLSSCTIGQTVATGRIFVGTLVSRPTCSTFPNAQNGDLWNDVDDGDVYKCFSSTWTRINAAHLTGDYNANQITGIVETVDCVSITSVAAALTALPAAGGTIDARAMPGGGCSFDLGTFDPGTKRVTLLLGNHPYTFKQILIRTGLHIIGTGFQSSVLTSNDTTSGHALIFQGPTVDAEDILMEDFEVLSSGTANQDGIKIAPNGANNVSASSQAYKRIVLGNITGNGINLDASLGSNFGEGGMLNLRFEQMQTYTCNAAGTTALRITGAVNAAVVFDDDRMEEICAVGPLGTGVIINSTSATSYPTGIDIKNSFIGFYAHAGTVSGGKNIKFVNDFIYNNGVGSPIDGFSLSVGAGTMHSLGIIVDSSDFNNLPAAMAFIVNTSDASSNLILSNNVFESPPTAIATGFTNNILAFGNTGTGATLNSTIYQTCGTTTTCAKTTQQNLIAISGGPIALVAGTITITSLPYTSATSYVCSPDDSTGINGIDVVYNSGSSVTFNGTATDSIRYKCDGN